MQQLMDLFHRIYDVQGIVRVGGLALIAAIIFAETGLLAGFFLPGDSLLVTAGIYCTSANPEQAPLLNIVWLNLIVMVAAIVGDTRRLLDRRRRPGRRSSPARSRCSSRRKHLLRTQEFYERHGGKTIIIARFVPIIRTFAPVVAGVGKMGYRRFISYNVFGGIGWSLSMTLIGYTLGQIYPQITKQIDKVIIVIIAVSLMPMVISYLANRKKKVVPRGRRLDHRRWRNRSPTRNRAQLPRSPSRRRPRPPTHAEFAARLPAPVGKRFEVLRTYLKKQGAAEDLYYYGPRSGWAYRYLKGKQSVCSIMLLGRAAGRHRRPRQRRADEHRLERPVGRRPARAQARPRNAGAAVARRPARRHRRDRFKSLLKAKLARVA